MVLPLPKKQILFLVIINASNKFNISQKGLQINCHIELLWIFFLVNNTLYWYQDGLGLILTHMLLISWVVVLHLVKHCNGILRIKVHISIGPFFFFFFQNRLENWIEYGTITKERIYIDTCSINHFFLKFIQKFCNI